MVGFANSSHGRELLGDTFDSQRIHLQVGGSTRAALLQALRANDVSLNAHAETLLDHAVFDDDVSREITVIERTVGDLGLTHGATLPQIFAAARERGLELCPATTGPYLRLAMAVQESAPDSVMSAGRAPSGAVTIASAPLSDDVDYPKGFYLRVVDDRQWLRGYRCDDEHLWSPDDCFAFGSGQPAQ